MPTGTKAGDFRRRAAAVAKSLKLRNQPQRAPLLRKQKALIALADNEDWLDGAPNTKTKPPAS